MPDLKHSKVWRGGITASYLSLETETVRFETNAYSECLEVRFHMASKGGGTTSVKVQIALKDLSAVLEAVAADMPQSAAMFSKCATVAAKRNLAILKDGRARAESAIEKLKSVEQFASEKYSAAPAGEDQRESDVVSLVREVLESLGQMRQQR